MIPTVNSEVPPMGGAPRVIGDDPHGHYQADQPDKEDQHDTGQARATAGKTHLAEHLRGRQWHHDGQGDREHDQEPFVGPANNTCGTRRVGVHDSPRTHRAVGVMLRDVAHGLRWGALLRADRYPPQRPRRR